MAVKLFFEMNNLGTAINWKRIARGLPRAVKYALNDRAITVEEIRRLTEYMDPRIKALVYTMASSGIRLGAWEFLKFKHIIPMPNGNGVAKIIVYAGEPEQYFSFVTPEAFAALQEWKAYRESYGEKVTGESWVMRDLWQTSNIKRGARGGLATYPRKLKIGAIKKILNSALWQQNLRQDLPEGSKRHEFKLSHGFRKFLKTRAEGVGGMKPLNVEMILGHDSGISESYWRPTEQEVFEDYCKSVDALTINTEEVKLQRQVTKLTESAVAEAEMMRSNMKELQDKIARLEANQAEMSKLYTIESGNFRLIQDKNDPNNMIPHVYNEKSKALEPVKGEENLKKLMPWLKPNVGEENIVWLDPDSFPTEEPIKGDFITVDAYPLEYNKKRKRYELIPAAGGTVD